MHKFLGHLKTVIVHKWWVFFYCCKFGIPFRGIIHDLSKFRPVEFFESVKYYSGTRSPIDACKELNGVSKAWMSHKGRNKHHYEYWQDNFDAGTSHIVMPFKYSLEMLCDYLGAGRAYSKKSFTYKGELEWFKNKLKTANAMHPVQKAFIYELLKCLANNDSFPYILKINKDSLHSWAKYKYDTVYNLWIQNPKKIRDLYPYIESEDNQ